MKKLAVFLLFAALFVTLCPGVLAQSSIQTLDYRAVVSDSGACSVDLTVNLHLDAAAQPVFPIPSEASDVTLNGSRGSVTASGQYKLLSLSKITGSNAGSFTFQIHYSLPGVVDLGEEGLVLTLPLLCGFSYPVDNMHFSVTLPSEVTTQPVFTSSYYQELIGAQMTISLQGNTLTGDTGALKDHETLSMTLPVTDAMFPQPAAAARVMGWMDMIVLAFALLTILYFLLAMRPRMIHLKTRTTPPDGVSAGDLQMWLTGSGVDFSLLVVTWAQLGYLRIQLDDNGRVLLHKRMDMGNERSRFENRAFRSLFGHRRIVDGTGYHYANLCRVMWRKTPGVKDIYRPRTGNPKILYTLGLITGMLSGVLIASAFMSHSLFLKILLACVCGALSVGIQAGGAAILRRQKLPILIGASCMAVWITLGVCSDEVLLSFLMILLQFAISIGGVCGGKRTFLGHQIMEEIWSLRRHMRFGTDQDMTQLLRVNPNYFHDLAPYALALGLDRRFAHRFNRLKLQECNYLIIGSRRHMSATEWAKVLRSVVDILDAKAKRLPLERFHRR